MKKTTVILVDTNQRFKKPVLIPTFLLDNWKLISFSVLLFLGLGIYTFVLIGKFYFIQQKNEIQAQHAQIKTFSQELRKQYDFITWQITEVNNLLDCKGIQNSDRKIENIVPKFNSPLQLGDNSEFQKYLEEFKSTISYTPLGSPLEGRITSSFGIRSNPFFGEKREVHKGLDISARHGSMVRCTADGKVVFAKYKGDFGKLVIINHGDNYETHYGHLSEILVKEGQEVKANTFIGKVGSTGRSSGPHLHYEIHKNDKKINPETFINVD